MPLALVLSLFVSCGNADKHEGTTLAKVNGQVLTLEDLMYQLPPAYRDQLRGKELTDAVDSWINTELLHQKGLTIGLDKDPTVQAVIKFRTSEAIARKYVDMQIADRVKVTPGEVDSIYAAQKDRYKYDKERLRASHILVETKGEADAIYGRLKKGDDFARLAGDYSLDKQSAPSGGDIGFFSEDQIDRDFATAALKLKVGEFSGPIKTAYGYHIIKLTDRQAAGASADSTEVKSKILESLITSRQQQVFDDLVQSLKRDAKIERMSPPEMTLPVAPDSVK
jgi:parvulin-like peptidyl-prolyl isomerase